MQSSLEPQWIPREKNTLADSYSRWADKDDWSLVKDQFMGFDLRWRKHTVDRFANASNAQCARFNSRLPCPSAEATDAFAQSWEAENNWLCPPVRLIPAAIAHACKQRANSTLIVPCWPSSFFWPLIMPIGSKFANFVSDVVRFYGQCRKSFEHLRF